METAVNVKTSLTEMVKDGCLFCNPAEAVKRGYYVAAPAGNFFAKGVHNYVFVYRNVLIREHIFERHFNSDCP